MTVVNVHGVEYGIATQLWKSWNTIKDGGLKKMDSDRVYIVDGRERSGKSVFAIQQACYIDPTLVGDLSRICFTAEEFLDAIKKTDIRNCKIKDITLEELADLYKHLQIKMGKLFTSRNNAINSIIELIRRFKNYEQERAKNKA